MFLLFGFRILLLAFPFAPEVASDAKISGIEKFQKYQGVIAPLNTLRLVGIRVGETLDLTSVTPEQPVQIGTDLVSLALAQGVALCAAGLEEVGTLLCVSCFRNMSVKVFFVDAA
jgi:hypothetical protein